jgi:signal transduction histidine kinase
VTGKILYMEDDVTQARLAKACLERAGFSVDVAHDGTTGLAMCTAGSYDAMVIDQTMPGLNGLQVIRAVSAQGPLPPTIMVTGTGDEQIAVQAMKAGVDDYLVKDLGAGFVNVLPLVVGRVIEQHRTLLDKQRIEKQLAQSEKMRAIGQLAAGMAHEINTPTQYIADNARFLQSAFHDMTAMLEVYQRLLQAAVDDTVDDALIEEVQANLRKADLSYLAQEIPVAIEQSLDGVEHIADIVGAMKEFSHPGTDRKQAVDLNHTVEGAITMCRNEWKYVADVVTDFDAELPLVPCLASDIHRVVVNLIVNAAHAIAQAVPAGSSEKRKVTVATRRDGADWVEIRVRDEGVGIPGDVAAHVFEPFFTTKDVGEGTGQGLAIAHAIVVEKHGGTIQFETQPGVGTTFVVRLPLEARTELTPETATVEPSVEEQMV